MEGSFPSTIKIWIYFEVWDVLVGNLDLCSFRCCCMPVLLVFSYTCKLDLTTSACVWQCSSLVHSLVPWAGNDVFRQFYHAKISSHWSLGNRYEHLYRTLGGRFLSVGIPLVKLPKGLKTGEGGYSELLCWFQVIFIQHESMLKKWQQEGTLEVGQTSATHLSSQPLNQRCSMPRCEECEDNLVEAWICDVEGWYRVPWYGISNFPLSILYNGGAWDSILFVFLVCLDCSTDHSLIVHQLGNGGDRQLKIQSIYR